jgi:2-polyprenyl-3-methyl-5-hydroxy-6-metoxy-1,4-benzoquinol methylase/uncharacterized protein YbaR (Trm112 family)
LHRQLLDIILCPACAGILQLTEAEVATIEYSDSPREEIRSGTASCECGRRYPIADFVLSFANLFPPILQQEAAYWDRYYLWLLEQGSYGFHDLRQGQAPYITQGVPEPFPEAATLDRYDIHHQVAEHPLLRRGKTLLDVGVGLGWTTLYFARAGYDVTAFEPSLGPVTAAKRYAIEQGVFIEYMCAAMGAISFRPASFDNVTAFHSLHHVPNLEAELRKLHEWLRPGGALALDEHIGNSKLAAALGGEVHRWAENEVLPRYRTLSPEALGSLPQEPHSALEDSSVNEVVPLVHRFFDVNMERTRHVFLDHYPLLYYLHTNRDLTAYKHALPIANQLQDFVRQADPEGGDYITIVAENSGMERRHNTEPLGELPAHEATPTGPEAEEPQQVPEELTSAQQRAEALEAELREQGEWARGLERELARKNSEIARLNKVVKRLENGRVMRLLRLIPGRSQREKRG